MRRDEVGLVVEDIKKVAVAGEVVNVSDKVGGLIENMTFRFLLGRSKDDRFDLKGIMTEAFTWLDSLILLTLCPPQSHLTFSNPYKNSKPKQPQSVS
ncbi:hypothetical protein AgCh_012248 [Apium graveolens]